MSPYKVLISLKPALLDSAGRAVNDALHSLGFDGVTDVRVGKLVEIEMSEGGRDEVEEMCKKLLANPVIETYEIEDPAERSRRQNPGSNCDQDALHTLRDVIGVQAQYVWHRESSLDCFDAVVIPGGFTYGDYLRGGAIAALSPIIAEVKRFADEGKPVIGICNGFQILTEAGILPGALVRNEGRRFLSREVYLKAINTESWWTRGIDRRLSIHIAHNEGRYIADDETLAMLEAENRIAFVYCEADGRVLQTSAPNGSTKGIAGILNSRGNVLGMMPHPERGASEILGNVDGRAILDRLAS